MAKRKVKSSSRLFAITLIPRTCKYCFNSRTFIRSKFGSVVKENHQNSSFPNSRRPFVYIFTRISLAFVHPSQDDREYETRLLEAAVPSFFSIMHKRKWLVYFITLTGIVTGTFILFYRHPQEVQSKATDIKKARERLQMAFRTKLLCPAGAQTSESPRFVEVEKGTLLYSAWFDDRLNQMYIRILLMTWRREIPPPVFCCFHSESYSKPSARVASTYYEINKGNQLRYGLYVVSCAVQDELTTTPPSFVEISIKLSRKQVHNIVLPVGNTCIKRGRRREYGICIPPLFGNISAISLIEFLELSQVLGASSFTFYDFETSDNLRKVINYYVDKGLAQLLSWKLPSYISQQEVHYHGQIFAMQECLFRRMNDLKFVAFNDLDEFIVPLQYKNMISLLRSIHRDEHCGHCFKSARFLRSKGEVETSWPMTQNVFKRLRKKDETHPKCVVDPQSVFEQGVHLIMNPLEEFFDVDNVEWDVGRIFHYTKSGVEAYKHTEVQVDKTMLQRYGGALKEKIENIRDIIGFNDQSKEK